MKLCKLCGKKYVEMSYCLECRTWMKEKGYGFQGMDYTREKVRIRDNQTCQNCGKIWVDGQRKFDVHHLNGLCGKKSRKYDKVSEMDGLITLCHKCHFNHPEHSRLINR